MWLSSDGVPELGWRGSIARVVLQPPSHLASPNLRHAKKVKTGSAKVGRIQLLIQNLHRIFASATACSVTISSTNIRKPPVRAPQQPWPEPDPAPLRCPSLFVLSSPRRHCCTSAPPFPSPLPTAHPPHRRRSSIEAALPLQHREALAPCEIQCHADRVDLAGSHGGHGQRQRRNH